MTKQCTWIGDGEGCTHTAQAGSSYCAEHHSRVYQVGSGVRRKKDARRAAAVWDLESEFNAAVQELIDEGFDPAEPLWDIEVEA
jgi:hypothetical protein